MTGETFGAPWDRSLTYWTSFLVVAALATAALLSILAVRTEKGWGLRGLLFGSAAFSLGILVLGAMIAPRSYYIDDAGILVRRSIAPRTIPRETILGAEVLPPEALVGSIRTFGVGGLFGYVGRFQNSQLGSYALFATRAGPAVGIRTTDGLVVVTPDRPEEFAKLASGLASVR